MILHPRGRRPLAIAGPDILHVTGEHNVANALAAAAAAAAAGVSTDRIARGLAAFRGLPDRNETIASARGVTYINDSIATTPESAAASIRTATPPVILIAGGRDKGLDPAPLVEACRGSAKVVLLTGDAAGRLEEAFGRLAPEVEIRRADGLAAAVDLAGTIARSGDTVMLSPGCSSFDEFRNYRDRADAFRRAVGRLGARVEPRRAGG
jgi:UDP-N-acetylmuramoylalanine--D-glutamate ligase